MNYYLYRHIRLDKNTPFYIGIGTKTKNVSNFRTFESEYKRAFRKKERCRYWKNITNLTKYEVEILFETDDRKLIKEKEREFIKLYGRLNIGTGTLVNLTDGGDGLTGKLFSEQELNVMSKRMKSNTNWKNSIEITKKLFSKTVYQYDINTLEFIKEWKSCTEAFFSIKKEGDPSGITHAARTNRRMYGYIWSYILSDKVIPGFKSKRKCKVL